MSNRVSIVINTCAGSKDPKVLAARGSFDNTGKKPYAARAEKLREMLKRLAQTGAEIIVTGEWEPGEGYIYVESPGRHNDPTDQIPQRHDGAQAAHGDIVVFLNDDHFPTGLDRLVEEMAECDVGAFQRFRKYADGATRSLETGWPGYVMGHACVMTQKALSQVPWSCVPISGACDVAHTAMCAGEGLRIKQLNIPAVWDIETGEMP